MSYSYKIDAVINNILEICNDCDTFAYHRRYGYAVRLEERLGSGRIIQAIGLFTAISLLSKLHKILQYGFEMIDYTDEYKQFKKELKEKGISSSLIERYVKPKSKIEINETEAFVLLIKDYPDKFGLEELTDDQLRKLWNEYRNHLIHTLFLGNETMIIETIVSNLAVPLLKHIPDINNFQEERYTKIGQKHSFSFNPDKEKLRGILIANALKEGQPIELDFIMRATHDEIKIDSLNIDVRNIAKWIQTKFINQEYSVKNTEDLKTWLNETGIFRTYKSKMPDGFDIKPYLEKLKNDD